MGRVPSNWLSSHCCLHDGDARRRHNYFDKKTLRVGGGGLSATAPSDGKSFQFCWGYAGRCETGPKQGYDKKKIMCVTMLPVFLCVFANTPSIILRRIMCVVPRCTYVYVSFFQVCVLFEMCPHTLLVLLCCGHIIPTHNKQAPVFLTDNLPAPRGSDKPVCLVVVLHTEYHNAKISLRPVAAALPVSGVVPAEGGGAALLAPPQKVPNAHLAYHTYVHPT